MTITKLTIPHTSIDQRGHLCLYSRSEVEAEVEVTFLDGHLISVDTTFNCGRCGDFTCFNYDPDTKTLTRKGAVCLVSDNLETVIRLDVPSGKMIVNDSLRSVYSVNKDDLDYCSALGQSVFTQRMAEIGCAYGAIGNRSPGVYQLLDGSYVIGIPEWDEEADDYSTKNGWIEKSWICTDLWAYSIADYQDWLSKGGPTIEEDDDYGTRSVIDVKPGVYEFRIYSGRKDFDDENSDGPTVYAEFKLVEALS